MASRRNRIIYASQSVQAEGRVLYRVQTLGSTTTFNSTDLFELGQLNLTDVVDDSPDVAVTLDGLDYGSIYTMATLAKVPVLNLNHNIRQSDGTTFFGTVSGVDVSTGTISGSFPASSGTGKANIVIKESSGGSALAYLHGVSLIDFGRECGISKGIDLCSPVQSECSLGTANNDIEFTKLLKDVFINSIELNYQSTDNSNENYRGETAQKKFFLNDARFLSWEEWNVGTLANQISAVTLAAKNKLVLSLESSYQVATLDDQTLGFLKSDLLGRPSVLMSFVSGGGLTVGESKAIPIFDKNACTSTTDVEYFIYDSSTNELAYYANGLPGTLINTLPAGRSAFISGDKVVVFYAANGYAAEIGSGSRPVGADSTYILAKYFAPVGTEDVEDVGGIRKGQIEAYLVDPDLIFKKELTGATVGSGSITFSGNVASNVDLERFVGLNVTVVDGPGKNGPARAISAATNNIVGSYNNGSLTLAGSDWANIRLVESASQVSTSGLVYVSNLCGIDDDYIGSSITVKVSNVDHTTTIASVDSVNKSIGLLVAASGAVDDGSEVLVSAEPTTDSTILVGDYSMALRLQNVRVTADLTRERLNELGHLNPYARTLTLPLRFTVAIDTTASDLETFATFAGKLNKFKGDTLTDVDIIDLLAKDNLAIVVMIYQQTDLEAGGTGSSRKVLTSEMFGDEYFFNGVRYVYDAVDGSLREYPLKTVVVKDLRITDEAYNLGMGANATQTYAFRGTNEVTVVRGYVGVDLASKVIESQGE